MFMWAVGAPMHLPVKETNEKNKTKNDTEILLRQRYCWKWTSYIARVVIWVQRKKNEQINEVRDRCESRISSQPAKKQKK